ncbi:MAG: maleylpyruvate isomerase family mycothiol-dependent enzyme [Acidimicrobiia bacterium]
MTLARTEYLDHLARESTALADAAAAAGADAPVPSCPGWTVTELVRHAAGGDTWARLIVETGSREGVPTDLPDDAPTGDALVALYRDGADALVRTLTDADPAASVWTFSPVDRTVSFWIRRRAHESTVHRVDAEGAAGGEITPIDPAFASDGIDEYLHVFAPRFGRGLAALGGTIHLHCTDVEGEWLVAPDPDGDERNQIVVTREHAKGDVAARGRAEDLLLLLWGRRDVSAVEVFGDADLLQRFVDAVNV